MNLKLNLLKQHAAGPSGEKPPIAKKVQLKQLKFPPRVMTEQEMKGNMPVHNLTARIN